MLSFYLFTFLDYTIFQLRFFKPNTYKSMPIYLLTPYFKNTTSLDEFYGNLPYFDSKNSGKVVPESGDTGKQVRIPNWCIFERGENWFL